MIKLTPIILMLVYGFVMYRFSVWQTLKQLNENSAPLRNAEMDEPLRKLSVALDLPRVKVHVLNQPVVNGLAAPDGRIFITKGFLDKLATGEVTSDELTSVVAHELGHVALGHSRRRMIDFGTQNAMRTTLAMIIGRFIPGIGPWIANVLTSLLAARLSRGDEYEADSYASALMIKAGIGTGPQKSLFEKLNSLTGAKGGAPVWFLSHPKIEDRIAAIEANEAKWL